MTIFVRSIRHDHVTKIKIEIEIEIRYTVRVRDGAEQKKRKVIGRRPSVRDDV